MSIARPYTAMMVDHEIHVLRRLHAMLAHDQIETREQFGDLMKAAFVMGKLDAKALSNDLAYNVSAVYRWVEGRTAPHPSLWPRIVEWIKDAIEHRIAQFESNGGDSVNVVVEA